MLQKLLHQIDLLHSFILKGNQHNSKVSDKGTYWQIDHSLQVLHSVADVLKNSDPKDYHPKFSFTKLVIMGTGYIPRGKGRAPKQTIPQNDLSELELLSQLEKVKVEITNLSKLNKNKTFKHPLFGWLNLKDTIKFMGIHTNHHIKIINDILK
jgi:hypothetical protein